MGLLTLLPFLMKNKGISPSMMGTALALVFIGGAAGKFVCGWLGSRMGVIGTVLATEGGTAALILAVIWLPLAPAMALLPLLGMMLNGTSSVLYGTVPELTPVEHRGGACGPTVRTRNRWPCRLPRSAASSAGSTYS